MMHRCSEAHGQCSCGFFHSQNGSFSLLFGHKNYDEGNLYSFSSSTSNSGVDCTLSLGTPSTRLSSCDAEKRRSSSSSSSCMSNFCWDFLHSNSHNQSMGSKGSRGGSTHGNSNFGVGGGETLLARRCANCDTTSTPLWRNGPKGPKSLCNACGIRFKKEERRATTATATTNNNGGGTGAVDAHNMLNNSWVHHAPNQKVPYISSTYGNEFRFIEEDYDRDSDAGAGAGAIPFLSWRPNVTARPSLVHNFTM